MNKYEPKSVDVTATNLKITWADGHTTEQSARLLRAACNCATCVSEITGERMINLDKIPENITITKAQPTGNYAITIHFSDFHTTGIYTYEYLRNLNS